MDTGSVLDLMVRRLEIELFPCGSIAEVEADCLQLSLGLLP